MRFSRLGRITFQWTSRREAAYRRKLAAERAAMPLFSDLIAAEQLSVADEAARRVQQAAEAEASRRAHRAKKWREARRRLQCLPDGVRQAARRRWQNHRWLPGTPEYLLDLVRSFSS